VQKTQCGFVKDFSVLSVSIENKGVGGRGGGGGPKKKPVSRSAMGVFVDRHCFVFLGFGGGYGVAGLWMVVTGAVFRW
jgi:hypothetical protein